MDPINSAPSKLEWMYKGPGNEVDREEYLLGKAVNSSNNLVGVKNEVERDCLPVPLFGSSSSISAVAGSSATEQVDIVRKIHEDPLMAIKKKEIEKREQLLKNPVKMKKLQDMIKRQKKRGLNESGNCKKKKRKKKKKAVSDESGSDDTDIEEALQKKYKKLKTKLKLNICNMLDTENNKGTVSKRNRRRSDRKSENISKHKKSKSKKRIKKESSSSSSSSSDSDDDSSESSTDEEEYNKKNIKRKKSVKSSRKNKTCHTKSSNDTSDQDSASLSGSDSDHNGTSVVKSKKKYGLLLPSGKDTHSKIKVESEKKPKKFDIDKKNKEANKSSELKQKYTRPKPVKLSEAEKEERRKEMMKNAEWRNDFRDKNIKMYKEKDEKEKKNEKDYSTDFYRKQLSYAVSQGSVEGRIKSNVNRIQRTAAEMDRNFAKR